MKPADEKLASLIIRSVGKATKRYFAKRADLESVADLVAELESRVSELERKIAELLRQREDA